jgi:hypothetical protein
MASTDPRDQDFVGWAALGLPEPASTDPRDQSYRGGGTASAAGGDLSPAGLAALFRQPNVTLPRAEEAKGAFRDLQLDATGGLRTLLGADPTALRESLRKAIYDPAASDINFQADRAKQSGLETMFGKNMGVSSVTGDYVLEPVERARLAALERAANDAFVQANTMANQNTTTQAQVLGQAFNQGGAGLQGEAGIEASNRAANQGATQAGYQTGIQTTENAANRAQQESQFGRTLGQQATLQREAFKNTRDIADKAATAASVGAGIGGLAQFFAPAANNALGNMWDIFRKPA